MEKFRLGGAVALVTGVSSGIGMAIAVALAEAGADIVAVHRGPIDRTRARVEDAGRRLHAIPADLSQLDAEQAASVVNTAVGMAGQIDILVNNAGTISRSPALHVDEDAWQEVLQTNLTAVFLLTQAVGRHFMARPAVDPDQSRGKVINLASMLSFQGGINVAAYTASKSGVAGLTRLLANEWASTGINVNAIAPGYIATKATEALRADPQRSGAILDRIPAGRWGQPADIGSTAVFLASAAANYIHGAIIPVDGGWLAR